MLARADSDNDGYISKGEMYSYLSSVFTVLLASRRVGAGAVSVADLAASTTEACFAVADTDGDGRLSREEFQAWLESSGAGLPAGVLRCAACRRVVIPPP